MPKKFRGKNSLESSIALYYERGNYQLTAYEDFDISLSVRDLTFGEFQMYGRINTNLLPVVPKEQFLTYINTGQNQDSTVRVLDFVADAFAEVQEAFRNACLLNMIPQDDAVLSIITPVKGYDSPIDMYSKYIEDMFMVFNETYIIAQNRRHLVLTINDYMNELVKYLQVLTSTLPLTFSSWQKSNKSSIFTSGIAISISNLSHEDDSVKEEFFFNNRAFQYYLNVCKQHGFNVSKNAPWCIFADIGSTPMAKRLSEKLIQSPASMFGNRFDEAYTYDIQLLEEALIRNYNKFVSFFPIEKKYKVCNNNNKLIYNKVYRYTTDNITENISQSQIIKLYANMKNVEENYIFSKSKLNIIIKNANNLTKRLDIERGIGYINEKFRQTFKSKNGGINSIIRSNFKYTNRL